MGGADNQPLVLHWNGTQWAIVTVPTFNGKLAGVTAISQNDIWAVGNDSSGGIAVHWNGAHWNVMYSTNGYGYFHGVDGIASNDVWAASDTGQYHWDGAHWNQVPVPVPPDNCVLSYQTFESVSMISHNDVWFAGYCPGREAGTSFALALHWDGQNWAYYPVNLSPDGLPTLTGIDAVASNDVWAVGFTKTGYPGSIEQTVAMHWDGTQWTRVSTPNLGAGRDFLKGVAATGQGDVWAAGYYQDIRNGPSSTLLERYYPSCPIALTPTPTTTPTLVPPPCPGERFTDVCPGDYFYTATLALADDGILSGYSTAPPCNNSLWIPCFRPYANITRGQIAKVASLAAGFHEPVSGQYFLDVPPGSTFYEYIQRMASRGIMVGYPKGDPHCLQPPPGNMPCFFPNRLNTRSQLSKVVALTFNFSEPVSGQTFEDVPPSNFAFYPYIERLASRGIIGGYPCGGPSEPCIPPNNRPYFRPYNSVTRGQTAKIVQLARTQPTPTLTPTSTITSTQTAVSAATATLTPVSTITATQTPANPDCQGNPPSQDVQISPGNCEPAGTAFSFSGSGFQPSESVRTMMTMPDGTPLGAPYFVTADNNGNVGPVSFNTNPGDPTGVWHLTFEGMTSQHQAIGYFKLLPTHGPRK
jgi:hypothetical protein